MVKKVLGPWIEQNRRSQILADIELKNRGLKDDLIAVGDGLKGFFSANATVFHEIWVPTHIVHLLRNLPRLRVLKR